MKFLYFPAVVYIQAHQDYIQKTGQDPADVMEYCLRNPDFFVEVAFSFIDGLPYPKMKESI